MTGLRVAIIVALLAFGAYIEDAPQHHPTTTTTHAGENAR